MNGWGSLKAVENYVLQWREDHGAALGEGLSRTSSTRARLFEVLVEYNGMQPMREWLRATTPKQAVKFATNRYPTATKVTLINDGKNKRAS